jgi:hypothetical protein
MSAVEKEVGGSFVDGKMHWTLSKPISAHGEQVVHLDFDEPSGSDLIKIGNPVDIDYETGAVKTNHALMANYIAKLANIPPSSVEQIPTSDQIGIGLRISPFFMPV